MKYKIYNIIFFPLSILYGLVMSIRNWLFDKEIIPTTSLNIPIISIGNLAVGGTGKTPHTEFLLSAFQKNWKIAVLSRGYKRKTSGFYLATENTDFHTIGDEPFQIHRKFPKTTVAVDEKRAHGAKKLLELFPDLQLIVLDDAMQHRHIQPGLSILLSDYNNLYTRDFVMPAGKLREWKIGSKRADIIVVTKCPATMTPIDMRIIESEIKPENNQLLFFSTFVYDEPYAVFEDSECKKLTFNDINEQQVGILLVAGIVNPTPIIEQVSNYTKSIDSMLFDDHYAFQPKDFHAINYRFDMLSSTKKIIIVTEKDAARIVSDPSYPEALKSRTYALPIRVKILQNQESLFIQKIKNYVVENSRNR